MTTATLTSPVTNALPPHRQRQVREYAAGGRVKGGILRAHLRWARENSGTDGFRVLLDTLPATRVGDLSNVLFATTWYPLQWLVDLDHAIVATIGEGSPEVLRGAGRFAASANLSKVQRSLLREAPHPFLRHVSLLQSQFTDFGASTWEILGSSSGRMTHRHWRCFSPMLCEASIGYYEECVLMAGGTGVNVEQTSCQCRGDKHCAFDVRWKG